MYMYFIKKQKTLLFFATLVSGCTALLSLFLFAMIGGVGGVGLDSFNWMHFGIALSSMLVLSVLSPAFLSRLSANSVFNVRMSLVRRVLSTNYDKFKKVGSEKVYNILINDVNTISTAVSELPTFIYNVILLVSCFSYLAYLSPQLFGVLFGGIILVALMSMTLIGRLSRFARTMRNSEDVVMESYKGMLDGFAQLSISKQRRRYHYKEMINKSAETLRLDEQKFRFAWDVNRSFTGIQILMILGCILMAGQLFGQASMLMSYALIITYCAGPFAVVLNLAQLFARSNISLKKIELLSISQEQEEELLFIPDEPPQWKSIRFVDVMFCYEKEGTEIPFSLNPVNLEINRGQTLFITGGNGSGKSTFVKLLLGLIYPGSGQIYIDNEVVGFENIGQYKSLFTTVLSDFYLFDNALDAHGNVVDETNIAPLLERFEMDDMIDFTDDGFSPTKLSQGQRKRLALISSIAEGREIIVLDEWAADQDPHFRKVFYEDIIPWLQRSGKTIIAVTHDDRYFHLADTNIKFEAGVVQPVKYIENKADSLLSAP